MKCLLLVDAQYDFFPGGALAVPEGDRIIKPINRWIERNSESIVIASQDWHPIDTKHFSSKGGVWPIHCVQESIGARIHNDIKLPLGTIFVKKGQDPEDDAGYSAFEGKDSKNRTVKNILYDSGVKELYICGLATDYCVKATVLDALKLSDLRVFLLKDCVKSVDLKPGDGKRSIDEMAASGATLVRSGD
jgi:nicotinamidase/pyrazinamidase